MVTLSIDLNGCPSLLLYCNHQSLLKPMDVHSVSWVTRCNPSHQLVMAHPLCWVPYMARSRAVSRSCKGLYAAYRLIDAADISHCASVIKAGEISIEFYRPTFFDPSIRNHRSATTYNETTRHFWSSNLVCSQTNFLSLQLTLTRLLSDDCWWLWQLFLPRTWRNPSWLIPMRSVNPQQSWHGKQGTLKWAFYTLNPLSFSSLIPPFGVLRLLVFNDLPQSRTCLPCVRG